MPESAFTPGKLPWSWASRQGESAWVAASSPSWSGSTLGTLLSWRWCWRCEDRQHRHYMRVWAAL